ncbi:putative exported protein [Granulibacter bethesdensis CGDNIH4]|nr:putative exported protein [Granulibacter bethesdensis CGDNIH4]
MSTRRRHEMSDLKTAAGMPGGTQSHAPQGSPPQGRQRIWPSVLGVVSVAGLLIGANMLVDARLPQVQWDVTSNRIYTLSDSTVSVLSRLQSPITLKFFYSPPLGARIPKYGSYADRVREMLEQYKRLSHGMLSIEFYNPEPFSETEDRAIGNGLQGVPLDQSGEQVYFGLVGLNRLDGRKIIPFFQPDRERFLEYDLTRLIYDLTDPQKPVVGLLTDLPIMGSGQSLVSTRRMGPMKPWAIVNTLKEVADLRPVPVSAQWIDPGIQTLIVVHPQHLSEAMQYAIDQFIMRGGKLLLAVDPDSETQALLPPDPAQTRQQDGPPSYASNLPKLLSSWGVLYDPDTVVLDPNGAWRVRTEDMKTGSTNYLAWFNDHDGLNRHDPITADLTQVTVAAAGALRKAPDAKISFEPLLSSSPESGSIPSIRTSHDPDPQRIAAEFHPSGGPRVLAARIRGHLKSAFSGKPDSVASLKDLPEYVTETKGDADIVILSDSDIFADRFWVHGSDFFGKETLQPFSDNGIFLSRIVSALTGNKALGGIGGSSITVRPFTVVETMNRNAQGRFRQASLALQTRLQAAQDKLIALRQGQSGDGAAMDDDAISAAQEKEIQSAQQEIQESRKKLRLVEHDLSKDISTLETRLRLLDIGAVPLALIAIALGIATIRRIRRQRARR